MVDSTKKTTGIGQICDQTGIDLIERRHNLALPEKCLNEALER